MQWYFPLFTSAFLVAACVQIRFDLMQEYLWLVPVCFVLSLGSILAAKRFPKVRKASYLACLLIGCGIGLAYVNLFMGFVHAPLDALNGKDAEIFATVTDYADRYEDSQRVTLRVDTKASGMDIWMPSFSTMAYVPLTEEELVPGDQLEGRFSFYRGSSNGGFDRAAYYAGRNFHILTSCDAMMTVTKPEKIPLTCKPLVWAHGFQEKLDSFLSPRSASFVKALLFGDKSDLTTHDRQSFQKAGLSHVMAVSGMHVGFLVAFFILVIGRRFGLLLSLAAIMMFVPMAGASPSVIRAAIMYGFAAMGFFLRLENSALHSMCAALIVLLLYNPYSVGSLSLQLSFLATLGLIWFGSKIQGALLRPFHEKIKSGWVKKALSAVTGALSCSISAMVFTMPVLLSSFGYVSAASVIANLLTLGVFSVVFICGFLLCFLGGIPVAGTLLVKLIESLCAYIFCITGAIEQITPFLLYWDTWFVKAAVAALYLIFAVKLLAKKCFPAPCVIVLSSSILLLTLYANAKYIDSRHETVLFSAGSGQTITVSAGPEQFAVIDCSGSGYQNAAEEILAYMDWYGYSDIDLLVLTALDLTHARNVPQLLESVPVHQLILPAETKESEIGDHIFGLASEKKLPLTIWDAEGEQPVGDALLGISVIGGMPRKLGVRIRTGEGDLLTLHSFTPKMTDALLERTSLACDRLVVSEQHIHDRVCLDRLIASLGSKEILLPSGWYDDRMIGTIPMRSTKTEGDICYKTTMDRRDA